MDLLLELLLDLLLELLLLVLLDSAAAVCIYYVSLGRALRARLDVRDKIHTAAAPPPAAGSVPFVLVPALDLNKIPRQNKKRFSRARASETSLWNSTLPGREFASSSLSERSQSAFRALSERFRFPSRVGDRNGRRRRVRSDQRSSDDRPMAVRRPSDDRPIPGNSQSPRQLFTLRQL